MAGHPDHVAALWRPLALNPYELRTQVEDEVVALDCVGTPNADTQVSCLTCDLKFCNGTLLIGREHVAPLSNEIGWAMPHLDNLR